MSATPNLKVHVAILLVLPTAKKQVFESCSWKSINEFRSFLGRHVWKDTKPWY